jgi:phosphoribosyl 1,2-cyclic phosphodiesterase
MMRFTVWGARGSHPTPITPQAIRSKIASVVQRIKPSDLNNAESRERFLASLPAWLFGTTGGNTACVQLELDDQRQLVFDAGSGIVGFAWSQLHREPPPTEYHIFFTHFHYDHVQGFPFFVHAFNPNVSIHLYSPLPDIESILSRQMQHPFFPITMEQAMQARFFFHQIGEDGVDIYGHRVRWRELNHPGRAFGYRVDQGDRSFGYITDIELREKDFERTESNARFFEGLDAMIIDTQYTLDEAIEKYNWGHSSFSLGVDFAVAWGAKRMYMFHHEPQYSDKKLEQNLQSARWYAKRIGGNELQIELATEGCSIDV